MKIDDLPSAFLLTDKLVQQLKLLPQQIVEHHVQVLNHEGRFYHLNPDLVFDMNEIVLCPIRAEDPMIKNEESIAVGNDYGLLAHLKPLNGTTRNECVPIRLYNINLQIWKHHSTNHSIAFPIDGPVECLKMLPCAVHMLLFLVHEMHGVKWLTNTNIFLKWKQKLLMIG